jgi:hypothetical protein
VITTLLAEHAGWRPGRLVLIPLVLIAGALGAVGIRNTRRTGPPSRILDLLTVPLLAIGTLAFLLGLQSKVDNGWSAALTVVALVFAVPLAAGGLVIGIAVRPPLLPPRLLAAAGSSALTWIAPFAAVNAISYAMAVSGHSQIEGGYRMLALAVGFLPAAVGGAALTIPFGPRPALMAGGGLGAVTAVALALSNSDHMEDATAIGLLILTGLAFGFVVVGGTGAIAETAADGLPGFAGGVQQTTMTVGGALAASVFLAFPHYSGFLGLSYRNTLFAAVAPALLGALLALAIGSRKPQPSPSWPAAPGAPAQAYAPGGRPYPAPPSHGGLQQAAPPPYPAGPYPGPPQPYHPAAPAPPPYPGQAAQPGQPFYPGAPAPPPPGQAPPPGRPYPGSATPPPAGGTAQPGQSPHPDASAEEQPPTPPHQPPADRADEPDA